MEELETTVLYYTADSENEPFAGRIRAKIMELKKGLPMVSVSQKPLPGFGKNICVGVHDNCYNNLFRQVQIGLREVETPYVLTAEADFLYPPEYFAFKPPKKAPYYRFNNVYVHYNLERKGRLREPTFFFKGSSNGAQAINRNYWLAILDWLLDGEKEWFSKRDGALPHPRLHTDRRHLWQADNPAVTFKTGKGVRAFTDVQKRVPLRYKLPYWGFAKDLRKEMFG